MKKELKELIKSQKLSDEDLIKLIQSQQSNSESEKDVKDEDDESETSADSKEQKNAEKGTATESPKPQNLSLKDLEVLIQKNVLEALKSKDNEGKLPAQQPLKPVKKEEPKAKPKETADFIVGGFNLVS